MAYGNQGLLGWHYLCQFHDPPNSSQVAPSCFWFILLGIVGASTASINQSINQSQYIPVRRGWFCWNVGKKFSWKINLVKFQGDTSLNPEWDRMLHVYEIAIHDSNVCLGFSPFSLRLSQNGAFERALSSLFFSSWWILWLGVTCGEICQTKKICHKNIPVKNFTSVAVH